MVTRLRQEYSFHKSQETSDLAPFHKLYNVRKEAPLLQRHLLLFCVVVPGYDQSIQSYVVMIYGVNSVNFAFI